jgi:hypothetical protein
MRAVVLNDRLESFRAARFAAVARRQTLNMAGTRLRGRCHHRLGCRARPRLLDCFAESLGASRFD